MADSTSGSRACEISPRGSIYLPQPPSGVNVHTNHFLENHFVEEVPWQVGSVPRLKRIKELVNQIKDEHKKLDAISPKLLRERVFSDRQGAPTAICCHVVNKDGTSAVTSTLFNIVMEFELGMPPKAEVQFGRPGDINTSAICYLPW